MDFLRGKENVVGQPHAAIYVEKAFRLIRWALGPDPEKTIDSVRSDVEILSRSPHELIQKLTIARIEESETFKTNDHIGWEALSRGSQYVLFRLESKVLDQSLGFALPEIVKLERERVTLNLTKAQFDAYRKLAHFLRLKKAYSVIAGIRTRPNPLIIGPSGVGKTMLVQAFAANVLNDRKCECPLYITDVGSWIPDGARAEPNTLRAIRDWVRDKVVDHGIIFIDEVDKLISKTEWERSIVQNIFALLDHRLEWLPYWGPEEARKLKDKELVVGAGTWQEAQKKALKDPNNVTRLGARMHYIEEVSEVAEELLFRFNADLVFLDPMIETEIQERICSIHRALELPVPPASEVARLAFRASESGRQYRWIEAYLSRLIAKYPEVLERNAKPSPQNDASMHEDIL